MSQVTPHEEAGLVLQPILDVFSGGDGGGGFARLRHSFLPEMLRQRGNSAEVDAFIKMIYQMSKLCKVMSK